MRRFQASTHGRIFLLLIKKSNPKQEGTNMGRLTVLEQIAQDIAAEFGNDCEVVIHDLKTKEPEHSIIYSKRTRNRTKCR